MSVIDVYCDGHLDVEGQPTHERRIVARWVRIDGKWTATRRISADGDDLRLLKGGSIAQLLHNNEPLTNPSDWRLEARTRYRLECPCGLVEVRKSTAFIEVLDTLESHGASSLPLRSLVAKLA